MKINILQHRYSPTVLYITSLRDETLHNMLSTPGNIRVEIEVDIDTINPMWRLGYFCYTPVSGFWEEDRRLVEELRHVREVRDEELARTDWISYKHNETGGDLPSGYIEYRQWLRDIPNVYDMHERITCPVEPVSGSYMDVNIIKKLQPWSFVMNQSGNPPEPYYPTFPSIPPVSALSGEDPEFIIKEVVDEPIPPQQFPIEMFTNIEAYIPPEEIKLKKEVITGNTIQITETDTAPDDPEKTNSWKYILSANKWIPE